MTPSADTVSPKGAMSTVVDKVHATGDPAEDAVEKRASRGRPRPPGGDRRPRASDRTQLVYVHCRTLYRMRHACHLLPYDLHARLTAD